MSYKALFSYGWDIADEGVDAALDRFEALGLDTVTLAGSYHAGKFLRPHGRSGKVYFPEDGTVYFRADLSRYGAIRPLPHSSLAERDLFAELLGAGRLEVNAWLVLLHNTPLGLRHADATVSNCFDDRLVYSLCPAHPDVRAYAVNLARDIAERHPVRGLSLETPGFLPYAHGYHHEFSLMRHNRWLDNGLGLCFCRHCAAAAQAAGIDAARLRARTAEDMSAYLASDIDFPDDMAEAFWLADMAVGGELKGYFDVRSSLVTSLVAEIRTAVRPDAEVAVIPSVARPTGGAWYEGTDLGALSEAGITIEACFYEPSAARVKADLFDIRRRLRGSGKLRGILRPAHPDLAARGEFLAAVAALRAGGVEELGFYNWGHLREHNLDWIGESMRAAA
ncbi:MAG TPA: hypothetical protein VGN97_05290 [Mesorhizobium sp.]|jgi:hypothetical protein|nr:hypothetical protein [Mesorhizobium sp.]